MSQREKKVDVMARSLEAILFDRGDVAPHPDSVFKATLLVAELKRRGYVLRPPVKENKS